MVLFSYHSTAGGGWWYRRMWWIESFVGNQQPDKAHNHYSFLRRVQIKARISNSLCRVLFETTQHYDSFRQCNLTQFFLVFCCVVCLSFFFFFLLYYPTHFFSLFSFTKTGMKTLRKFWSSFHKLSFSFKFLKVMTLSNYANAIPIIKHSCDKISLLLESNFI